MRSDRHCQGKNRVELLHMGLRQHVLRQAVALWVSDLSDCNLYHSAAHTQRSRHRIGAVLGDPVVEGLKGQHHENNATQVRREKLPSW